MTLHHWWKSMNITMNGKPFDEHCQTCPCKHGYSDVGGRVGVHVRCRWVQTEEFKELQEEWNAQMFLLAITQ